ERRRVDAFREDAESTPAVRLYLFAHDLLQLGDGVVPAADAAEISDGLRAVRVVQPEHGGLREHVGRASARRVLRVALDFRRAAQFVDVLRVFALDKYAEFWRIGPFVERPPEL